MKWLQKLKDFWHFVWHDDSLLSWVLSIVLAFLIIKFLVYPGLSLILGSAYPVVAIVSGSMEHKISADNPSSVPLLCGQQYSSQSSVNFDTYWSDCGSWYENHSISRETFEKFPFKNGMNKGDVIVLYRKTKLSVGDVVVFVQPHNKYVEPIIHRVVNISYNGTQRIVQTKGDHNPDSINVRTPDKYLNEYEVLDEQIAGKALIRIPFVGYVKIWAYELYLGVARLFT